MKLERSFLSSQEPTIRCYLEPDKPSQYFVPVNFFNCILLSVQRFLKTYFFFKTFWLRVLLNFSFPCCRSSLFLFLWFDLCNNKYLVKSINCGISYCITVPGLSLLPLCYVQLFFSELHSSLMSTLRERGHVYLSTAVCNLGWNQFDSETGHMMCNLYFCLSSLHGIPQMRGGWLMGHLKEELVFMMCHLESSLYYFVHFISIVCMHCAGDLECIRRVCVYTDFLGEVTKYHEDVTWFYV